MTAILQAEGLVKAFRGKRVVDGVSLRVERGEIVGLMGPNGAGKTTSFRMICGMLEPDAGKVLLGGRDVTNWPMYRRAKQGGMGYLAQESSVFATLTVEKNILCLLELLGVRWRARRQRCAALLEQFEISHRAKWKAGTLSGGERRRLEIARSLVSNPEIIMLDEPFAGIDPKAVQMIQGLIRQLQDQGLSVLITDHAAREILQIVDRCYVISDGKVLCDGPPDVIRRHPQVREKYLGDMDAAPRTTTDEPWPGPPAPHLPTGETRATQPQRIFRHDDL